MYHRVWKGRAIHIMLDRSKTIMAFIECIDLRSQPHAASWSHKFYMPLQKNSESSLFKYRMFQNK